jgi:hypothetical protein
MRKFHAFYFRVPRTGCAPHRSSKVIGRDDESRMDTSRPKEYAMKTLLLGVITATTILGAAPASAEYREVRIVRDWDRDWDRPHWFRHFAWLGDCRDVTERRYRPNGTIEIRRIHRCD